MSRIVVVDVGPGTGRVLVWVMVRKNVSRIVFVSVGPGIGTSLVLIRVDRMVDVNVVE